MFLAYTREEGYGMQGKMFCWFGTRRRLTLSAVSLPQPTFDGTIALASSLLERVQRHPNLDTRAKLVAEDGTRMLGMVRRLRCLATDTSSRLMNTCMLLTGEMLDDRLR
jgi:hypothetical protein